MWLKSFIASSRMVSDAFWPNFVRNPFEISSHSRSQVTWVVPKQKFLDDYTAEAKNGTCAGSRYYSCWLIELHCTPILRSVKFGRSEDLIWFGIRLYLKYPNYVTIIVASEGSEFTELICNGDRGPVYDLSIFGHHSSRSCDFNFRHSGPLPPSG